MEPTAPPPPPVLTPVAELVERDRAELPGIVKTHGLPLRFIVAPTYSEYGFAMLAGEAGRDVDGFLGPPDPRGGAFPMGLSPCARHCIEYVMAFEYDAILWLTQDFRVDLTRADRLWLMAVRMRLGAGNYRHGEDWPPVANAIGVCTALDAYFQQVLPGVVKASQERERDDRRKATLQ